jgi:putative tricarboxylic transport membrane protein
MSESSGERPAASYKRVDIVVALIFLAFGAIVAFDSWRLGAKWGEDGPQTGYFPFYIGLIICFSSIVNLLKGFAIRPERDKVFVEVGQLKLVLAVLLPTMVYVGFISTLGIYLASALFVAFFMRWLGKYDWWKVVLLSIGNSVFFFVIFEVWFGIPLPKGPLESALGLG